MIKWIGCPETNFHRGRPFGLRPEAVVVHIMDGSFEAGESVFRDPTTQKSAHYGISKAGEVHQYVDENDSAFHAGIVVNPTWPLLKPRVNPNFYTIGIEHEGRPDDIWPETQLSASATLIGQIAARWNIALDELHVIRHHQIRDSKTCPGNWLKIAALLQLVPITAAPAPVVLPKAPSPAGGETKTTPAITPAVVSQPVTPGPPAPPASPIAKVTMVRTTMKANLRRGRPSTTAPIVRVLQPQVEFAVCGCETGEPVDGNANWYADVQGNFIWAGATDTPDPTAPAAAERARAGGIGQ
jgi:N-acetylmuramoyl-L-alanine amidase